MARRPDPLSPITLLDDLNARLEPTCRFTATDPKAARAWQRRTRKRLADCVGFLDRTPVPPAAKVVQTVDRGGYIRRKVILRTAESATMPVYTLTPKHAPRPMPCVLALHGHGYGVADIVGIWEDGSERLAPDGYHKDFGCALAERGFLVIAPEISCFGERRADYSHLAPSPAPTTCHHASTYAMMLGGSMVGLRVFDGMRAVDYLATLGEADVTRLGAMGISGGGMHTFFSAALDTRIRACVISGYFCDWRHSILAMHHCTCNFVPGLLKLGELSDLAGLIAPRPCLIEAGTHDEIFPVGPVRKTVTRARRAWRAFNAPRNLATDIFPGRHQISGAAAYDFLARHLR